MKPTSVAGVIALLVLVSSVQAQSQPGPQSRPAATTTPQDAPPVGGGAAGKFGGRMGGRKALAKGGETTAAAIGLGLEWLKAHQDPDGRWDGAGFMKHDKHGDPCTGAGQATHDVGITALALLAFLGDGSTRRAGPYSDVVDKAAQWLIHQQDEKGLFGTGAVADFLYDHAIATWAICEAYGLGGAAELGPPAQKAIDYLERHRNPYMVWRYQPRDNDNDTSATVWCVMAMRSAADFKLKVNPDSFKLAATWLDAVTDPVTGRAGYTKRGEGSSRQPGKHGELFPTDKNEALTSAALLCRFFLGQTPAQRPEMGKAANTILSKLPKWNTTDGSIDLYAWYFGTYALYQMGGRSWSLWSKALTDALVTPQCREGNAKGSWDPQSDVWGLSAGRVYTTAMGVLTLEAYYRYTRLVR